MGITNGDGDEKWEGSNSELEEEDEALSLCDLPLKLIKEEPHQSGKAEAQAIIKTEEDQFDFGSWGGSLLTESEFCAADEVFFKGQILPLRLSVSSDGGLTRNPSRCLSRSESMDHGSLVRFTSVSTSRSSSSRSHYSSSSTNSTTTTTRINSNSKPRIVNQFHTHPSPKPQIRISNSLIGNVNIRNQKSSIWDFFRLGLVRAPEIELKDLKVIRNNASKITSVSRNSSCSSNSSSSGPKKQQDLNMEKHAQQRKQSFLDKKIGLFSDCKCSVSAVETVPLNNVVVIKNSSNYVGNKNTESSKDDEAMTTEKQKLQELKAKNKQIKEKQLQGKQALSRHRTFEWLKDLSHASYPHESLA